MPLGIWQSMAYFCHPVSASELCFYPHIKMKPACFEGSFGRSLAPDADSERSWLPRGLILPVTHVCPSTNCLGNWGLVFLGGGGIPANISKGVGMILPSPEENRNHFQVAQWEWRQPEQTQAWASPWCCWRSPRGLLHPRRARRLRDPLRSHSHCACCFELILQRGDSWRANPCKDNESPDCLMTT